MNKSSQGNGFAVVTGASRGIGRAVAVELANNGYDILVNFRNSEQSAQQTADLVRQTNRQALVCRADVTDRAQVKEMLQLGISELGDLKVLVNNAGILCQTPFLEISDQDWTSMIAVNLNGPFVCTQEASILMTDGGSIVNISSVGGQIGGPKAPHYAASKGALLTLTKSTAKILAPRIRVNAVAPGFIRTDMFGHICSKSGQSEVGIVETIPLRSLGEPDDVAGAVGFLVSPAARYITGHTINVNGGILMS